MNLKEISIQKLMKATFAVLIGLSVINTLVILGAGTKGEGLTSNLPLLVSVSANLIFIILFSMISLYVIKKRVINPDNQTAKQLILDDERYSFRHSLQQLMEGDV